MSDGAYLLERIRSYCHEDGDISSSGALVRNGQLRALASRRLNVLRACRTFRLSPSKACPASRCIRVVDLWRPLALRRPSSRGVIGLRATN